MAEHKPLTPFAAWAGPRKPKILIIGEAWGREEELARQPFVGEAGRELFRMLGEAFPDEPDLHQLALEAQRYGAAWIRSRRGWLDSVGLAFTNVLNLRPADNKMESVCCEKRDLPAGYHHPPISRAKYLHPDYLPELSRLFEEISSARPNLVLAMGNTACWAILQTTNISAIRGTTSEIDGRKVLPTFHPASLLYEGQWSRRPIIVADLMKARREGEFPELRRPTRHVLISAQIQEYEAWTHKVISMHLPSLLACDIETKAGQITCIGFAASSEDAMVIPFAHSRYPEGSYWPGVAEEVRAWQCVKRLLESGLPLLFQNGVYDLNYLLRLGFKPKNLAEDTMLLHHALYPELLKGLGFLGSIYTNEVSWKLMRRHKPDTEKRDE